MTEKSISLYVEDMFPSFYKEEGPLFIQFVKAYYEWLEQQDNVQYHINNLTDYYDIDKTIDQFITHFRQQYLPNIEFSSETDRRTILKHAREFLATKGTEENIALLMKLVYNQDARIFHPNDLVLRPSDGIWYEPKYLELSVSPKTASFVGRNIIGSRSGATALAERVVRKTINGAVFDVLYITRVQGDFNYKELITSDGNLDDCPRVIGSMTRIDLNGGGKDFNVGDEVVVESSITGKAGRARVAQVGKATGRVTFDLIDGGYGFTSNAIVYVSDKVINVSNKTPNPAANTSNGKPTDFVLLEQIVQPMQTVSLLSVSNPITVNSFVTGYTAGVPKATGYVVSVPQSFNANNETIEVIVYSGNFANASNIGTTGNTITGIVDTSTNTYASGVLVGSNTTSIGVTDVRGTFSNSIYSFIRGTQSNTSANVASISTGSGANFELGQLTQTEEIFTNTDRVGSNNVFNQPYTTVKLTNQGFVEDVLVQNQTPNTTHLFVSGGGTLYTEGDEAQVIFGGQTPTSPATVTFTAANGVLYMVTVSDRGLGYSNNQAVEFSGNTRTVQASLTSSDRVVAITSGNTKGLYAGLAVTGTSIPANTFIEYVDPQSQSLLITKAPTATASGEVLSFPAAGYITTNSSGAIANLVITSQGSGYSAAPSVSVNGGTSPAVLTATIANGVIVDTRVDVVGAGYNGANTTVTATTSGVAANLSVVIDSGWGFPKDPNADLTTTIANALTFGNFTIGSIASLTNISLGSNYNQDPFVLVLEPVTAGFNRRDLIIEHDNPFNSFLVGETISQEYSESLPIVSYTNKNANNFIIGEVVVQGSARGIINDLTESTSTTGVFSVGFASGSFAANATPVVGQTSGASATVANSYVSSVPSVNRGVIKSASPGYITVARHSFNFSLTPGVSFVGQTSGTTANVVSVTTDPKSQPIGFNAEIDGQAGTISGFIQSLDIVDAGFGYKDYEPVVLKSTNNPYVASGYARLLNQGFGAGYFLSQRGFLNDHYNYIHDNDYWQEYSYEVRTGISLSKYRDVLKQAAHTAGTKFFGMIEKIIEIPEAASVTATFGVGDTQAYLVNGTGTGFINGEFLKVGAQVIGYASTFAQGEFYSAGFASIAPGTVAYVPNTSSSSAQTVIQTASYDGIANTMFITSTQVAGSMLPPTSSTIEVYTNTHICYTNTALYAAGVYTQLPATLVEALRTNQSNAAIQLQRASIATYKNANGVLTTASTNVLRPLYNGNNVYSGVLVEPAANNTLIYSHDFTSWANNGAVVISNDTTDPFSVPTSISQLADKVRPTATAGVHEITLSLGSVTAGSRYAFSCFFKKAEYTFGALMLPAAKFGTNQQAIIDLNTGATNITNGSPTVVVEAYQSGWYRLGITAVATTSGADLAYIRVASSLSSTSFTGDGTSGIEVFGAQFELDRMTSYVHTTGTIGSRAADKLTLTPTGWRLPGVALGSFVDKGSDWVALTPASKLTYAVGANNASFPEGQRVFQGNTTAVYAQGNVVFSNSTTIIATTDIGPFSKSFGPVKLANAALLSVASNSSSNGQLLQVGEIVTQTINAVSVTGTVYSKNSSSVMVISSTGEFKPSVNNTVGRIIGSTSGANVFAFSSNAISTPLSSIEVMQSFANGAYLVGSTTQSTIVTNTAHNSVALKDTSIIPLSNAINKVSISEFRGNNVVGSTLVGNTSGSTATILRIER